MKTKLSTKGQLVLPSILRRKLGLDPGDTLNVTAEAGRLILVPDKTFSPKCRIVTDPITGLPVLTVGSDAPRLTSKQVREALDEFP
jgi:AbrB family looped-hinge helix DNA binding protein